MIRPEYLNIHRIIKDESILRLFEAVHEYGGALRFVGGAVRDALAGIEGFEIDLATDLTPDELVEACAEKGLKTVSIGLKFAKTGVIINNNVLEVSSLHKPVKESISDFAFTDDWNADAASRDLTINAVYADEEGNVFDYYNGIDDLEKGVVRFIGKADEKIKEYPIRILRFFRFYSIFSKTEPDLKALKASVENKDLLKNVAVELIRDEFFKILVTQNAPKVLQIMKENDVLDFLLPSQMNTQNLQRLDRLVYVNNLPTDALRRLFVLFSPDAVLAENLAIRLHLTKAQKARLIAFAKFSFDALQFHNMPYIRKVVFLHGKEFTKDKILFALALQDETTFDVKALFDFIDRFEIPVFPLNGKDLIEMGMNEGLPIKEILAKLKSVWLDSDFQMSTDELKQKAAQMMKK